MAFQGRRLMTYVPRRPWKAIVHLGQTKQIKGPARGSPACGTIRKQASRPLYGFPIVRTGDDE